MAIITYFTHYCLTDDRCVVLKPPVVSRLLYVKPINSRFFIMICCYFSYSSVFFNVRVNYKRLAPIISEKNNKRLFALGSTILFALPCLAVFDHFEFFWIHVFFATCFFTSTSIYLMVVTKILENHKKVFPESDHEGIDRLSRAFKI